MQSALDFVLAYLLLKLLKCTCKLQQFSFFKKKSKLRAWFPPPSRLSHKNKSYHFNSQHTPHIKNWYCSPPSPISSQGHTQLTCEERNSSRTHPANICTLTMRTESLPSYRGELHQNLPEELLRSSYEHGLQRQPGLSPLPHTG